MHLLSLKDGQFLQLSSIPHGGVPALSCVNLVGMIRSFSELITMLNSMSVTDLLDRICPFTIASSVAMFSLMKNKQRLCFPEIVKPCAKYGQSMNMFSSFSLLLVDMSTLAMKSPIFRGLIPVWVSMAPFSLSFLTRTATEG